MKTQHTKARQPDCSKVGMALNSYPGEDVRVSKCRMSDGYNEYHLVATLRFTETKL